MGVRFFTKKDQLLLNASNQDKRDCMRNASFVFVFDSEGEAKIIAESLGPEIKHKIPKTNVKVSLSKKTFSLKIKAKDISSLRAACNSYLRWINTALSVKKTV